AIDTVTDINNDGYLIIGVVNSDYCMYGGHVNEDIIISNYYNKPFALIACSVTLHDPTPNDGLPVVYITASAGSPQNIFIMDLHADDSKSAGYIVEGNGRYLRNVFTHNNQIGIKVVGNQNTLHNNIAEGNSAVGILIQGNNNYVTDANAMSNGSHGIQVIGNNNTIIKCDAGDKNKGNKGNGISVSGSGNLLQENDAFANTMNGIEVSGGTASAPNRLLKNRAGDKGKGNQMHGIMINASDAGNGASNPIELEENTTKANKLDGIRMLGSGHQLKKNISGGSGSYPTGEDNGDWEYYLGAGNINAGGNKTNNALIPLVIPGGTGTP
ncbi:MAG: glycoside hydrolase family 55 protein, partial [Candidatus Sumerlaeia bacterium]|nr:glycoside hydrolase family 55 protein [Candidatus Sumerlaeia bacterium]